MEIRNIVSNAAYPTLPVQPVKDQQARVELHPRPLNSQKRQRTADTVNISQKAMEMFAASIRADGKSDLESAPASSGDVVKSPGEK